MSRNQKYHTSIVPGVANAVAVTGKTDYDLSFALKNFKRKVKNSGILEHVKENRTFTKPSVKHRVKMINAKYIQKIKDMHRDD
jgi:ribosomal protein S21